MNRALPTNGAPTKQEKPVKKADSQEAGDQKMMVLFCKRIIAIACKSLQSTKKDKAGMFRFYLL
jgi:hypothetical protein